jgi:hypothetical protein
MLNPMMTVPPADVTAAPESDVPARPAPNPRRVAAGRRNHARRRGFTAAGLDALRQAARKHRPWRHSTGPQTAAGKARSAANGRVRQQGPVSRLELRQELAALTAWVAQLQDLCDR